MSDWILPYFLTLNILAFANTVSLYL